LSGEKVDRFEDHKVDEVEGGVVVSRYSLVVAFTLIPGAFCKDDVVHVIYLATECRKSNNDSTHDCDSTLSSMCIQSLKYNEESFKLSSVKA
jgi:hypothetical protein